MNSEKKGSNTTKGNKMYPWFYAVCLAFMPTHERGGGGGKDGICIARTLQKYRRVCVGYSKKSVFLNPTQGETIFFGESEQHKMRLLGKKKEHFIYQFSCWGLKNFIFLLSIVRSINEKNVKWLASMLGLLPILWLSYMLLYF